MSFIIVIIVLIGLDQREEIQGPTYPTFDACTLAEPRAEAVVTAVKQTAGYPRWTIRVTAECRQIVQGAKR